MGLGRAMAIGRGQMTEQGAGWLALVISCSIGLLGGLTPQIQAQAQSPAPTIFTPEQIEVFAEVVLAMEPHRLEAHEQSQSTDDSQTKDQIRREFIRKATEIITDHGMTVPDYNRFVLTLQGDNGDVLKQQVEAQIRQIQLNDPDYTNPSLPSPAPAAPQTP